MLDRWLIAGPVPSNIDDAMCLRRAADDWRLTGGERQEPDKENGGNVESRAEKLKKLGALISDVMVVVVVGCNLRLITDKN